MVAQPMYNDPSSSISSRRILMGRKVPMLLGIPMKTMILSYHVVAILLLLKLAMVDKWLEWYYFVLAFGCTLFSYILIDSDEKVYVKIHFWICLLLCSIPATYIHITLIEILEAIVTENDSLEFAIYRLIVTSIFLILFGIYVWICRKFYQYLYEKPTLLPCHTKNFYEIHLNSYPHNGAISSNIRALRF